MASRLGVWVRIPEWHEHRSGDRINLRKRLSGGFLFHSGEIASAGGGNHAAGCPDDDFTSGSFFVTECVGKGARTFSSFCPFSSFAPRSTRKPFNSQSLISHLTNSNGCGILLPRFR